MYNFHMINRPSFIPKPISMYSPWLYKAARKFRIVERRIEWMFDKHTYCSKVKHKENLPVRVKKHQSVLIRKHNGVDQELQINKVHNLKNVISKLDGIRIKPNEVFSFCKLVGKPTLKNNYKTGMELVRGEARAGVGGGICQVSNLIFWLALHTPLKIIERHHHSFDPFPDKGRVLPFASGATVMYNYIDLKIKNTTRYEFELNFWLDHKCINGEIRCDSSLPNSYKVLEKNHFYIQKDSKWFRTNELWRRINKKENGGKIIGHEFIVKNCAEVKYEPTAWDLQKTSSTSIVKSS